MTKENLDGQFVFCLDASYIPEKFKITERGSWFLGTHPRLLVNTIRTEDGEFLGWILGYPVSSSFEFCPNEFVLPVNSDEKLESHAIESWLYEIGGRFIAIFLVDQFSRIYLDTCGSLAAVYSTEVPIVASTPSLIDSPPHHWDQELIEILGMPDSGKWYPAGLTPKKFVSRLLPNHYLNLSSWRPVRHWPKAGGLQPNADPHECAKQVINTVSNTISAVASKHLLYLNLTAGRDTRKVLACARSNLDRIQFFTFFPGTQTVDSYIASRLASRFKLNHIMLQEEYASKAQVDEWLFRVGHCLSGKISEIHQTQRHLDANRVIIPGMSGEIEKPIRWRDNDHEKSTIDARELLDRYQLPPIGKIISRTEEWLYGVSGFNVFLILDLMHIEQRLGCWGGPQAYGAEDFFKCLIFPFAHRRIYESVLSLPYEYRRRKQFTNDICKHAWPELLTLPFNEFPWLKSLSVKCKRKAISYGKSFSGKFGRIFANYD